jgi:hypothetical protein
LIQHRQAVRDFIGPEVEIRHAAGELVGIQRDKPLELRRKLPGDGDAVCGEGGVSFERWLRSGFKTA